MTAEELCHHEAAIKILSCCRGYLARQRVKALRFNIYPVLKSLLLLYHSLFFTFIVMMLSVSLHPLPGLPASVNFTSLLLLLETWPPLMQEMQQILVLQQKDDKGSTLIRIGVSG